MKILLVFCFVAFAIMIQANSASLPEQLTTLGTDVLEFIKKYTELSNYKTPEEREKLIDYYKTTSKKIQEEMVSITNELQKSYIPEDLKKTIEDKFTKIQGAFKILDSVELKEKYKTFQHTVESSVKKIADSGVEISKNAGLAIPKEMQDDVSDIYSQITHSLNVIQEKCMEIVKSVQGEFEKMKN